MTPKIQDKFKTIILTGYACNNNCRFCRDAGKHHLPVKTTAALVREVYLASGLGVKTLEILGGEAPLRKDFARIVSLAKKLGIPEVIGLTNGRVFSDPARAREIVEAGIDFLAFSVHGPGPAVHDALTRSPGSFRELCRGIENLRKLGFTGIGGNTTVVKANMRHLPAIAGVYSGYGVGTVDFFTVDPNYGGAKENFTELVPRISEAAPFLKRALDIGLKAGFYRWRLRYAPLCLFKGYEDRVGGTKEQCLFLSRGRTTEFINPAAATPKAAVSQKKTRKCRDCALAAACGGFWVEYLERYGDDELRPVPARKGGLKI